MDWSLRDQWWCDDIFAFWTYCISVLAIIEMWPWYLRYTGILVSTTCYAYRYIYRQEPSVGCKQFCSTAHSMHTESTLDKEMFTGILSSRISRSRNRERLVVREINTTEWCREGRADGRRPPCCPAQVCGVGWSLQSCSGVWGWSLQSCPGVWGWMEPPVLLMWFAASLAECNIN